MCAHTYTTTKWCLTQQIAVYMNISTHALCHTLVLRPMTDVRTKCFDNATLRRLQFEREIILRRFYGGRSMFAILGHSSLTELCTEGLFTIDREIFVVKNILSVAYNDEN